MTREWLVERRDGTGKPEIVVYPVDGGAVGVDDLSWVIARLRPDDEPMSTPIKPGPVRWEYTYRPSGDVDADGYPASPLEPGWEPFAVVEHAGESWVHLRRRVNDV